MSNITMTIVLPAGNRAAPKHFPLNVGWQEYAEYGDTILHCFEDGATVLAEYVEYTSSEHAYCIYERLFCDEEAPELQEVIDELAAMSDEVWEALFNLLTEE